MRSFAVESLESRRLLAAGDLSFAFTIGDVETESVTAQATDPAGNLYVAGVLRGGAVDFNSSPRKRFALDPGGLEKGFVAKYSPVGALAWARLTPARVSALAVYRPTAELLVAGNFIAPTDFGPVGGVPTTLTSNDSYDGYWGRLNPRNGTFNFVTRATTGSETDFVVGIDSDAAGNVYTAGTLGGLDMTDGVFTATDNAYVNKFNARGRHQWNRNWGPPEDAIGAGALAVDADGNTYTAGASTGNVDFDPFDHTGENTTTGDVGYVVSHDPLGNVRWLGVLARQGGPEHPTINDMTVDPAGNLLAVGSFRGDVDFNFSPNRSFPLATGEQTDAFLAKYAPAGGLYYARQIGMDDDDAGGGDAAFGVAVDSGGYVHVGGSTYGQTRFNPGVWASSLTSATQDGFVAKYQANGKFVAAWQFEGTGNDRVALLAAGAAGSVFASGALATPFDADPGAGAFALAPTDTDLFVIRLA